MKREELLRRMDMDLPMCRQIRVIVSSDVSNEADDPFAVAHHLLTPVFDVRGIIASHYESKAPGSCLTMERSYQELLKLMNAMDIDDIPALRGCISPLETEADIPESEGADFIIKEALREDSRPLYVAVQGALTDVAAALNRCPEAGEHMTVVWIGGGPYPQGCPEFNLMQDIPAARAVFASKAELWQIPVNVYGTAEVTMAEMAYRIRPCGTAGRYLYQQLETYNRESDEPYALRKGENWTMGDSPTVAVLMGNEWRGGFHTEIAPYIDDEMKYLPVSEGKKIRVYDSIDVRALMEDLFAKLALCYR